MKSSNVYDPLMFLNNSIIYVKSNAQKLLKILNLCLDFSVELAIYKGSSYLVRRPSRYFYPP